MELKECRFIVEFVNGQFANADGIECKDIHRLGIDLYSSRMLDKKMVEEIIRMQKSNYKKFCQKGLLIKNIYEFGKHIREIRYVDGLII